MFQEIKSILLNILNVYEIFSFIVDWFEDIKNGRALWAGKIL